MPTHTSNLNNKNKINSLYIILIGKIVNILIKNF